MFPSIASLCLLASTHRPFVLIDVVWCLVFVVWCLGVVGDGFYGTPSLAWGNGFNVSPGDTVHFTFSSVSVAFSFLPALVLPPLPLPSRLPAFTLSFILAFLSGCRVLTSRV